MWSTGKGKPGSCSQLKEDSAEMVRRRLSSCVGDLGGNGYRMADKISGSSHSLILISKKVIFSSHLHRR